MKNITTLLLSLVLILPFPGKALAQEKAKVKIASMKQKGDTVLFTLNSSSPFIFGNNRYILHISDQDFYRNRQSKKNGKGILTFMIPADNFKSIKSGVDMYLSYGELTTDNAELAELSTSEDARSWSLGKLNKALLTK